MQELKDRMNRMMKLSALVSLGVTCVVSPVITQMMTYGTDLPPDFVQRQLRAALFFCLLVVCTVGAEMLAQLTLETPDNAPRQSLGFRLAKRLVHAILYAAAFVTATGLYIVIRWEALSSRLADFVAGLWYFAAYSVAAFFGTLILLVIGRAFGFDAYYKSVKPS